MGRYFRCKVLALMLMPSLGLAQDFDKGETAYLAGDYGAAMQEFTPLATQGDVSAQVYLGIMYDIGAGAEQNYLEAAKWYRLAADQGDGMAQNRLGIMYLDGRGMPQDFVEAHMWFNISAANGQSNSKHRRDYVAAMMAAADVVEAQRRAKVCMASNYQDCD